LSGCGDPSHRRILCHHVAACLDNVESGSGLFELVMSSSNALNPGLEVAGSCEGERLPRYQW
jgi:hypothetical protein